MSQNLDKNKIRETIQKARPQDLFNASVNPANKDSKKRAIAAIDKFLGSGSGEITIVKR